MTVTDRQVRTLMSQLSKTGKLNTASDLASMSRETGRKYRDLGLLPSQIDKPPRSGRTRKDPFEEDWPLIRAALEQAPELEAKTLFDDLCERFPDRYQPGQLRTLQRKVRRWRAMEGPPKEVYFQQDHRPGEALQTDFTWAKELAITIAGERFDHMLCQVVLPYSNWQHITVCRSESLLALQAGVQSALHALGHAPKYHQTDNSTAATHQIRSGDRSFNEDYLALMRHYGLTPRTIAIGKKEQNGDVESLHGVLKRRVEQHLLLRGSRDFVSVAEYEDWLKKVLEKANRLRQKRLREELAVMRVLSCRALPSFREERIKVSRYSLIRVLENSYSVPSRLIGQFLRVKIYEDRLEVFFASRRELVIERLLGRGKARINYRHLIDSLLRKSGAFARYRFREELFPNLTFRKAYDALAGTLSDRHADLNYLRILKLAATTMESEVEAALELFLEAEEAPLYAKVRDLISQKQELDASLELEAPSIDLSDYDELLASKSDREAA